MEYQIGDIIVHPLHGAGIIQEIEYKRVEGKVKGYYVLMIPKGDMRVMIPVDSCEQLGVRPILDLAALTDILREIPKLPVIDESNWNRRCRENMLRLKSGELLEVAVVIKSLVWREARFGLSNGERKMLHSAKQILVSEMMLIQGMDYEAAEQQLYDALNIS